ncbi:MAG: nucleotide pyrophosphohydrolase [Candidatus Aenigmarchaeota archaeon]|nr:nucleotide pyrophosphohydrolase [Candidatus Aenigmarchaeota archaeon]
MATIEEITKFQKEFDKLHGWINEFEKHDEKFLDRLQYATIALAGEVGEFSNILKKVLRDKKLDEKIDEAKLKDMREELVDVFIYLIILSIILKADLGKEYFDKMNKNQDRFKKYERQ